MRNHPPNFPPPPIFLKTILVKSLNPARYCIIISIIIICACLGKLVEKTLVRRREISFPSSRSLPLNVRSGYVPVWGRLMLLINMVNKS